MPSRICFLLVNFSGTSQLLLLRQGFIYLLPGTRKSRKDNFYVTLVFQDWGSFLFLFFLHFYTFVGKFVYLLLLY